MTRGGRQNFAMEPNQITLNPFLDWNLQAGETGAYQFVSVVGLTLWARENKLMHLTSRNKRRSRTAALLPTFSSAAPNVSVLMRQI
jgi:hypothetical protein